MATETYKILFQSNPTAASLTDTYAPSGVSAIVSSIVVANRSAVDTSFRISVAVAGAGDDNKQYLHYDFPIAGNDTVVLSEGITLASTDVIRVYATLATLSFNIFGVELS
jgi:hypothetical protein